MIDRHVKEELQTGDGGVERDWRCALVYQVQLIAPQIFSAGRIGRAPKKHFEPTHGTDIVLLRLGRELAHAHVVDHPLAQRAGGTDLRFHGLAPVGNEANYLCFTIETGATQSTTSQPESKSYRASGLVHWPIVLG